jgi:hypothetical protein
MIVERRMLENAAAYDSHQMMAKTRMRTIRESTEGTRNDLAVLDDSPGDRT